MQTDLILKWTDEHAFFSVITDSSYGEAPAGLAAPYHQFVRNLLVKLLRTKE